MIRARKFFTHAMYGVSLFLMGGILSVTPLVAAQVNPENQRDRAFQTAAAEFDVPVDILKSISYNQSRWENHNGEPSASGGYGLMHLTDEVEVPEDGRGDPNRPVKPRGADQPQTLDQAAQLLSVEPKALQTDDVQNIRGAAAVLSRHAREINGGQHPTELKDWYGATAHMSQAVDSESAQEFADNVYETMKTGVSRTTADGQTLSIPAQSVESDRTELERLHLPKRRQHRTNQAECPRTLVCKFVAARFAQNNPDDPSDYGNYDEADREDDMRIKYIVIHDAEGSYQSAIDWYQNPASFVSAHYTIRSSDGEITQSVKNKDVAWHAGNWYMNMHSIGIEHEGVAAEGGAWYTEAMYRSSAKLVRYLAEKYDIPLDREHIVGHDQYHGPTPSRVARMHWDPGPYWDWEHYMNLLNQPTTPTAGSDSRAVTIDPIFSENRPLITQCNEGTCTAQPEQGANFVYLRTEPDETAPLLGDAGMHPGGEPGTTEIQDWSSKAIHGQRFAVAERQGDWTAIWFGGQKGWFYNPSTNDRTALPARARLIKPRDGLASIPVYGRPVPEASVFPAGGPPVQAVVPLQYNIPANQTYVAYDKHARNDYYHVLAFDRSGPGDGSLVIGNERYIPISYNHRQAYVKASDVTFAND